MRPVAASDGRVSISVRPGRIGDGSRHATAGSRGACDAVTIERIGGDPSRHQDHRHARTGMRSATREVKALHVRTAIGRLERPQPAPVGRDAVDRAVQDAVPLVDVGGGQPALDANAVRDIRQSSRVRSASRGSSCDRREKGDSSRDAGGGRAYGPAHRGRRRQGARRRVRSGLARRRSRSDREQARPACRSRRTPPPGRWRRRSCGAADGHSDGRGRGRARRRNRPVRSGAGARSAVAALPPSNSR